MYENFLDSCSKDYLLHVLNALNFEQKNIMICNENLDIIYVSKFAYKFMSIELGENLKEVLSQNLCQGVASVLENKSDAIFIDDIEGKFCKIHVTCIQQTCAIEISFVADYEESLPSGAINTLTRYNIIKYLSTHIDSIKSLCLSNYIPKEKQAILDFEYRNLCKLYTFMMLTNIQLIEDNRHFQNVRLKDLLDFVVDSIKKQVKECDIQVRCDSKVVCGVLIDQMIAFLMIAISNVFSQVDHKASIEVAAYDKGEKIHVYIKNKNGKLSPTLNHSIFDLKTSYDYKELGNANISLPIAKAIANNHYGICLLSHTNNTTTLYLTFSKTELLAKIVSKAEMTKHHTYLKYFIDAL